MNCIKCGRDTTVLDTRMIETFLRRRRQCLHCKHRFSTYEIDDGMTKTIKKYLFPHSDTIAKRVALTRRNEKIVALLKQGVKHAVVAAEFGLSDNMISTIANRAGVKSYRKVKVLKK